jgi:hypothetical protein
LQIALLTNNGRNQSPQVGIGSGYPNLAMQGSRPFVILASTPERIVIKHRVEHHSDDWRTWGFPSLIEAKIKNKMAQTLQEEEWENRQAKAQDSRKLDTSNLSGNRGNYVSVVLI